MKNKRLIIILSIAVIIVLIPLIAMQFTNEVSWALSDFIIAGFLLLSTGLLIELVLRKAKKNNSKILIIIVILILLILTWVELAVGIFGSPFAGS